MPLISCICNKGMRDRHWAQVSDLLGYAFQPNETTTLQSMLGMKLVGAIQDACGHRSMGRIRTVEY